MYGQTQEKTRGCLPGDISTIPYRLPEIKSMCRVISTGAKALDRHAGYVRPQLPQEWRYLYCTKANGGARLVKQEQLKCSNERAFNLWPHRENKAGKSLGLQPFCYNSLSIELRYEKTRCLFRDIQTDRLHGAECEARSTPNSGKPSQVETAKKVNFRCPIGGRSNALCPFRGRNVIFKMLNFGTLFPQGTKPPLLAYCIVPPRVTYLD